MTVKKQSFISVREIVKTYFPAYLKQQQNSTVDEDLSQTGTDLARELTKEFEQSLGRTTSGKKK